MFPIREPVGLYVGYFFRRVYIHSGKSLRTLSDIFSISKKCVQIEREREFSVICTKRVVISGNALKTKIRHRQTKAPGLGQAQTKVAFVFPGLLQREKQA